VIRAVPDSAKVYFDDAPLVGNPATATFQRDGLAHRVRAEAPGHTRKTELVVLDSSTLTVELELEPEDDLVDPFGNKLTQVMFKAAPADARLFVDDVLLPTNPSIAKLPRDGREHSLRADAVGFVSKSQQVRFDAARLPVTWTLAPMITHAGPAKKTPPPTATEAPPSPTIAVAALPPPVTTATHTKLDRDDPWKDRQP
jgi:hypothetical protein